jgi:hypothetical protein
VAAGILFHQGLAALSPFSLILAIRTFAVCFLWLGGGSIEVGSYYYIVLIMLIALMLSTYCSVLFITFIPIFGPFNLMIESNAEFYLILALVFQIELHLYWVAMYT